MQYYSWRQNGKKKKYTFGNHIILPSIKAHKQIAELKSTNRQITDTNTSIRRNDNTILVNILGDYENMNSSKLFTSREIKKKKDKATMD